MKLHASSSRSEISRLRRRLRAIRLRQGARHIIDQLRFGTGAIERICSALVLATVFFLGFLFALQYVGLSTSIGLGLVGLGFLIALIAAGFLIMGERDEKLRSERALVESFIASLRAGRSQERVAA